MGRISKLIISFIVCPNGNGHLFRTLEIIVFLSKKIKNIKINIFCSKFHEKKINQYINLKKIKVFSMIPNYDLRKDPYSKLTKLYNLKLKDDILKKSKFIFSDNLVNKYLPTNKTILHANFFGVIFLRLKVKEKFLKYLKKNS